MRQTVGDLTYRSSLALFCDSSFSRSGLKGVGWGFGDGGGVLLTRLVEMLLEVCRLFLG